MIQLLIKALSFEQRAVLEADLMILVHRNKARIHMKKNGHSSTVTYETDEFSFPMTQYSLDQMLRMLDLGIGDSPFGGESLLTQEHHNHEPSTFQLECKKTGLRLNNSDLKTLVYEWHNLKDIS
jgi:hypothetical protein